MHIGRTYGELKELWARSRSEMQARYESRETSFVPNLLPEDAVEMSLAEFLEIIRGRFGRAVDTALEPEATDPALPVGDLPPELQGPLIGTATTPDWLTRANLGAVNVRTVRSFFNVAKYALTLPAYQNVIHLLPIWEPGVVGSLYGISSFQINAEFIDSEAAEAFPHLESSERQLRATLNLLRVMGFAVGMDVIPHTDRFSEVVLANPGYFEWLRREDLRIVDHRAELHEEVQGRIAAFVREYGPAAPAGGSPANPQGGRTGSQSSRSKKPPDWTRELHPEELFSEGVDEARRRRILFGLPEDKHARDVRRGQLVQYLHRYGYEPVPATMAPPYRGLEVDPGELHENHAGNEWRDYRITRPQSMSRVFGPLARFKLYERARDNRNWEIDFSRPRTEVWDYVCRRYAEMQRRFGFEFMRGDMSHVQMRPEGVPHHVDRHYDLLKAVRNWIREENDAPYFGYFAEGFLAPRNVMGYGDEVDHLEASDADTTLGDLQAVPVESAEFVQRLRWYRDIADCRWTVPSLTIMTGDKDDPRFDEFYRSGSELRLFLALFMTDMPSYMALGFETRDVHHAPAPNEHYTKLFVFQEKSGPKATTGPYRFGRNGNLFYHVSRIRLFASRVLPEIQGAPIRWLVPPDATAGRRFFAWTQQNNPRWVFVANADTTEEVWNFNIPAGFVGPAFQPPGAPRSDEMGEAQDGRSLQLELAFTTAGELSPEERAVLRSNGRTFKIEHLGAGEGRAYRIVSGSVGA